SGGNPASSAGAGPKATPAPGSIATPRRGDDWGQSNRNVPGGQRGEKPGLFNSDGSVRLAQQPGSASPGFPPGTITQEIKNIDRAGTWLRRKPNDYEPTSFDKYWRPHETLLQEWVSKGFKEVAIPIPGTSKSIVCGVSLLALGGACSINDPNLNEQPAIARPPPDIPFKPGLQEDNGSVKPPPGG
ncbi:MAG: transmembrane repetitive protein, partial [Lysobacter sp.]|nr:transmembrane repetitive protein [Lysobacter sp.]